MCVRGHSGSSGSVKSEKPHALMPWYQSTLALEEGRRCDLLLVCVFTGA